MDINEERLQEMIETIYNMKEEMEIHSDETFDKAHSIAELLQDELELIQNELT